MAVEFVVDRNCGHPWDRRPGWDGMYVTADTPEELSSFIAAAGKKFWNCWVDGPSEETGKPGAYLYKPIGATRPWKDDPDAKPLTDISFKCHECGTVIKLDHPSADPTTSTGCCPVCGDKHWNMYCGEEIIA